MIIDSTSISSTQTRFNSVFYRLYMRGNMYYQLRFKHGNWIVSFFRKNADWNPGKGYEYIDKQECYSPRFVPAIPDTEERFTWI